MDIKKKRRNLIIGFMICGLIPPAMLLTMHVKDDLAQITFLFSIVPVALHHYFSSVLKWNDLASGAMGAIGQMVVYSFWGWLSARLVYPNKKLSSETDIPSEPAQD